MHLKRVGRTGFARRAAVAGFVLLVASGHAMAQSSGSVDKDSIQDRSCAAYGAGYVRVLGSATCIKISGYTKSNAYTQKYGFTGAGSNNWSSNGWGSSLRSQ